MQILCCTILMKLHSIRHADEMHMCSYCVVKQSYCLTVGPNSFQRIIHSLLIKNSSGLHWISLHQSLCRNIIYSSPCAGHGPAAPTGLHDRQYVILPVVIDGHSCHMLPALPKRTVTDKHGLTHWKVPHIIICN